MRVLHVIPSISSAHGGPSLALAEMTRTLSAHGIDVDVATTDDDGSGRRLDVSLGQKVIRNGVGYYHFRKQTEFYKVSQSLNRWLSSNISQYDLVHIHALFSFASVVACRHAIRHKVPYIIRPLGVLNRWGMLNRRRWMKALSLRIVEGPILRRAAAVHYTSAQEKIEGRRLGLKVPEMVIPLGIDVDQYARLPSPAKFYRRYPQAEGREIVLYLSRLDPKKGIELLLLAFVGVAASSPNALLVIAGDGDKTYTERLKRFAAKLLPPDSIIWTGYIGGVEKLEVLSAARIFVLPSHSENFGIAVVEAMAAGLPCVVTKHVAVAREISNAQAGLVVGSETPDLANALKRLLADHAFRESCGHNAQKIARINYASETMGESLLAAYRKIVFGKQALVNTVLASPLNVDRLISNQFKPSVRVLHVIPSVGPVRGGPSQAILETVRALRDRGIEAEILTTNDNGADLLDVPVGGKTMFSGVPVWFFPRRSFPVEALREFIYSPELTAWLKLNIEDYDLIHVHAFFSYTSTMAMRLARQRHIPYLVRPLGLLCRWSLTQSRLRKQLYLALVERKNLNHSAGLEYTAEQELEEALPLALKAPSFILPFGLFVPDQIPTARTQLRELLQLPADEPVILFLSRLHPKKGLELLIESLCKMASRRFSLVIAGSGSPSFETQLRDKVAAGPLSKRVHFIGFAQGELKQVLLQGADLFALTSQSESFAIAVLEALAAGLPTVITPGVPLASLVKKFNLGWVALNDSQSIQRALESALDDLSSGGGSTARRERARAIAKEAFSWDRIAQQMEAVYNAILTGCAIPSFRISAVKLPTPCEMGVSPTIAPS